MDLTPGARGRTAAHLLTREEVLAFAAAYDPQAFHLSDDGASGHPFFDRLAASGWHTASVVMRLTVDFLATFAIKPLGGAGVDDLRWTRPVYPGDSISAELEVLGLLPGKPRPGMTIVRLQTVAVNQDGEPVMRHLSSVIFPDSATAAL